LTYLNIGYIFIKIMLMFNQVNTWKL